MLMHITFLHIFVLCCQPATDVPLGLIHIQNLSGFRGKGWINLHQSLCDILMYCAFAYPKLLCSLSYSRIVFDNIIGNIDCSFFDIFFQRNTPRNTFLHCMRGIFIYDMNTPLKPSSFQAIFLRNRFRIRFLETFHIFIKKGNTI